MKLKVGIFFGGPSREREISFAGGRTVYDNLNQSLFEPIPIFVDSHRQLIALDWHYVYKGSIRDFYPPVSVLPDSPNDFQVYLESLGQLNADELQRIAQTVGRPLSPEELPQLIDVAFLALHGQYGEDGQIQQELSDLGIPYTGSGVRASQIGMDKALQKELMAQKGFPCPKVEVLTRSAWLAANVHELYERAGTEIGFPLVIRPANQGSSIGVSIIEEAEGLEAFELAINRAFFRELIPLSEWQDRNRYEKIEYVRMLGDIRDGLGFPLTAKLGAKEQVIYSPDGLLDYLNDETAAAEHLGQLFVLEAHQNEQDVILESFIKGKEFSCIVIRTEDGSAVALPPTEIIKGGEVFDYRSKYLPGLSRKETPIQLPDEQIEAIRRECERLFTQLGFQVYARIDGFFTEQSEIFLNDPNTTSGMLPSSFFFHQAAEIGLNPSQFLTFIVRASLQERLAEQPENTAWQSLLQRLDSLIREFQSHEGDRKRIGVILGGYSFERHISVESGRNIFEKLASASEYEPLPIFLVGNDKQHSLHQIPINLLLKDNADDIRDKINHWKAHPLLEKIRRECRPITEKYASAKVVFNPETISYDELARRVNGVFIALHGRPGEDGQVQMQLEARHLPYNGSSVKSSSMTIDKYRTLQELAKHGLPIAEQLLLSKRAFDVDADSFYRRIETTLNYPLIAKPVDDGCSSAVKVIRDRTQLEAYVQLIFQVGGQEADLRRQLKLKPKEEFPYKQEILFEELVSQGEAIHFLEITGGMLTTYDEQNRVVYEIFEPSETLASGEVLSLEEKFLAGEGQNLTPARLAAGNLSYEKVLSKVRHDLERTARLLNVEGYCRIDAFVKIFADGKVATNVIEVNSLPGMTPATAIFHQAALANYKPSQFIDRILDFGFRREALKQGVPTVGETAAVASASTVTKAPTSPVTAQPKSEPPKTDVEQVMNTTPPSEEQEPVIEPTTSITGVKRQVGDTNRTWKDDLLLAGSRIKHFFTSSYILRNIGAMLLVLVLSFFLLNAFLNLYTAHGKTVQVDNYEGLMLDEATRKARSRGFEISIDEAPYTNSLAQNTVIDQEPSALSRIKKNRTIYLTVIGPPKEVPLPEFSNYADDFNQYKVQLDVLEVEYDIKERVFDAVLEPNTILSVYYEGKKYTNNDLRRGVKVLQGSKVSFVMTKDKSDNVRLPSLVCKRLSEAEFLFSTLDLRVGDVIGEVRGSRADAYIWKQEPSFSSGKQVMRGSAITIYIQSELPAGCEPEIEITLPPESEEDTDPGTGTTAPVDTTDF